MATAGYEASFFVVCKCPEGRDTINLQMPGPPVSSCNKCLVFARGLLAAGIESHISGDELWNIFMRGFR